MKQREKLLAILAVAVLLLSQGMPIYSHFFVDPIEAKKGEIETLVGDVQDREHTERALRRARTNLAKWNTISLPSDWRNAQRLYLEWLTDLAKMTGFSDLKVTPTPSLRQGKVYTPVRVSLDAKVGYDQLCRFLDRFHKADLLHRIAEMNIKKVEEGGGTRLTVSLTAESLALATAEKREYLLPTTTLAEELSRDGGEVIVADTSLFPAKSEFLARAGNEILHVKSIDGAKWTVERAALSTSADAHTKGAFVELLRVIPKEKPNAPTPLAVDAVLAQNLFEKTGVAGPQDPFETDYAKGTYLRSLIGVGDKWEGWLYNPSNEKTILHEGSTFQIADLTATVVELKDDHIIVETGSEKRELRLGASLQSMGKKGDLEKFGSRAGREGGRRGDSNSEGGGRGRRGGRRGGGGRGFPGMDDPEMREKMRERFRKMRESGEMPDFGGFGRSRDGEQPADGDTGESSDAQPETSATPEATESAPSEK